MEQRPVLGSPDSQVCKWNRCLFLYEFRFLCWLYSTIMAVTDNTYSQWEFSLKTIIGHRYGHLIIFLFFTPSLYPLFPPFFQWIRCLTWRRYKNDQYDTFLPWGIHSLAECGGNLISKEAVQLSTQVLNRHLSAPPIGMEIWVNYLISLSSNFLIYKIAIIIPILLGFCES